MIITTQKEIKKLSNFDLSMLKNGCNILKKTKKVKAALAIIANEFTRRGSICYNPLNKKGYL